MFIYDSLQLHKAHGCHTLGCKKQSHGKKEPGSQKEKQRRLSQAYFLILSGLF
jgi:hypothetical protein